MADYLSNAHITNEAEQQSCSAITYQSATLSIPVTVNPVVNTGNINTFCCGEPVISISSCSVKNNERPNGGCRFTITQSICIEIPIEFSAKAHIETPGVQCGEVVAKNVCNKNGKK